MLPQLSSLIIIYLFFNSSKYLKMFLFYWVFPGGASGKESAYQCRRCKRCRLHILVRRLPWRRRWQPTPVFLPGESPGQRSLTGYSPWGRKELDTTEELHFHFQSSIDRLRIGYVQSFAVTVLGKKFFSSDFLGSSCSLIIKLT